MTPQADKIVDEWMEGTGLGNKAYPVLRRKDIADLKRRIAEGLAEADNARLALLDIREIMTGTSKTSMLGTVMDINRLVEFGLQSSPGVPNKREVPKELAELSRYGFDMLRDRGRTLGVQPDGDWVLFSDVEALLSRLTSPKEADEAMGGWVSAVQKAITIMERVKIASSDSRNELWVAIQLLKSLLPSPPKDTAAETGKDA